MTVQHHEQLSAYAVGILMGGALGIGLTPHTESEFWISLALMVAALTVLLATRERRVR